MKLKQNVLMLVMFWISGLFLPVTGEDFRQRTLLSLPCLSWLNTMWFCKLLWKDWMHVPEKRLPFDGSMCCSKKSLFCVSSACTEAWTTLESLSQSQTLAFELLFFSSLVQSKKLSFGLKKVKVRDSWITHAYIVWHNISVLPLENNKVSL